MTSLAALLVLGVAAATLPGCAPNDPAAPAFEAGPAASPTASPTGVQSAAPGARDGLGGPGASASPKPATKVLTAGNPNGTATVPAEARAVDTSKPTRTIGTGTAASCTSAAVVKAVAAGGVITFNCGPAPVTIKMTATAKVRNANGPKIVLDGGGTVTLSGQGQRRILYMNTCDQAQGFTTSHCQNQDHPQLTVQNLTFADGNSTGERAEGGGGGAIFVRGGRLKVVNSRFVRNRCDRTGPDLGGAAVRVLSQYENKPVYVVGSTFDGGSCSNGGALSSIGVSWVVLNSLLRNNEAIGNGANPAKSGTPGGGSGGAIYCDGNEFTVRIAGTIIENNKANEGGGAVFFVSNNRTGTMRIENSTLRRNPSATFETRGFPGIFFLGARNPTVTASKLS
ncbi:hypothetical protein AB0B74_03810 [Micromonospora parva]|uniref:hypothetical protein n=1 Tax=Micromonospora parva TaxID=1464048 RepID=UPI0033EF485B